LNKTNNKNKITKVKTIMMRKFNRPREGLERDKDGHRTGFKLMVRIKKNMSLEGWNRFSAFSKRAIAKHRFVYVTFHSTKQAGIPNGVPINIMADEKIMARYLIDLFYLMDGETYSFHSWTAGKTKTHCKLTHKLFDLEVISADNYKYRITNDFRIKRYWFRKNTKKHTRREEE
jgi:hypothetical protein